MGKRTRRIVIEQHLVRKLLFSVSSQSNGNITYIERPPVLPAAPIHQIIENKLSFKMSPNARVPIRSLHQTSIYVSKNRLDSYANFPVSPKGHFIYFMGSMIVGNLIDQSHNFISKPSDFVFNTPRYDPDRCSLIIALFLTDTLTDLPRVDEFSQLRIELGHYNIIMYYTFSVSIITPNLTWSTFPLTMPPKIDGYVQQGRESQARPIPFNKVPRVLHDMLYSMAIGFYSVAEDWHIARSLPNPNPPPKGWKFSPRAPGG